MEQIYSFDGKAPRIHPGAYLHPSACVIGDVRIGEGCFVGPHATLRGDQGSIRMEPMSNVQDNCVLHCSPGGAVVLSSFAQVGHGAVLHGCMLLENCLVGIHATVLDHAVVGANSIVAAHTLVAQGKQLDAGALYAGTPARLVRELSLSAIAALREAADHYADMARLYTTKLRRVERTPGAAPAQALAKAVSVELARARSRRSGNTPCPEEGYDRPVGAGSANAFSGVPP